MINSGAKVSLRESGVRYFGQETILSESVDRPGSNDSLVG